MGDIVIFARYRVNFIIEHENLVYDPINNKSIIPIYDTCLLYTDGFALSLMSDKLMYIPNDNTQNYHFGRFKLVVETFEHTT